MVSLRTTALLLLALVAMTALPAEADCADCAPGSDAPGPTSTVDAPCNIWYVQTTYPYVDLHPECIEP